MFGKRTAAINRGVAECFKSGFKNICGRFTHLYNNPWVYYYFSGENRLQNLPVPLSNFKTFNKQSFLLYFLYELLMSFGIAYYT